MQAPMGEYKDRMKKNGLICIDMSVTDNSICNCKLLCTIYNQNDWMNNMYRLIYAWTLCMMPLQIKYEHSSEYNEM